MIGVQDVCSAVEQTLIDNLPALLQELGLVVPTSYDMPDADALRAGSAELPAVVISSPGLAEQPTRAEGPVWSAVWRIVITAFARGSDYRDTAANVRGYALAIRTALLQSPSLGGLSAGTDWVGEEYAALESRAARTLGGAFVTFNVAVDDVTVPGGLDVPIVEATGTYNLLPVHPAL